MILAGRPRYSQFRVCVYITERLRIRVLFSQFFVCFTHSPFFYLFVPMCLARVAHVLFVCLFYFRRSLPQSLLLVLSVLCVSETRV